MSFTGALSGVFNPKWILLTGFLMMVVGTVLLAVGGGQPEHYWPYTFPAFVLGGGGGMLTYTHTK